PPDAVPLRFGEPSFADHLAAARGRGIEPVVLSLAGAGLDIDRPEDLHQLRLAGAGTRAAAALGPPPDGPPPPAPRTEVFGVRGRPELRPGDDPAGLALAATAAQGTPFATGDVVVLSQKAVSKAEGRLVRLADVTPSSLALEVGHAHKKDPRLIEIIL